MVVFLPGKYDNVYALQGYKVRLMQVVGCCFCDFFVIIPFIGFSITCTTVSGVRHFSQLSVLDL